MTNLERAHPDTKPRTSAPELTGLGETQTANAEAPSREAGGELEECARSISFFVAGLPKPAGSKRGFYIPKLKRVIITDANPNSKDWKFDVKHAAQEAYIGVPLTVPLAVEFTFFMPRPKGHFRTGRNADVLRPSAPAFPCGKPDVLKLARGVEDAMTAIIYQDDSQIVSERLFKRYAEGTPGVQVEIKEETP